MIFQSLFFLALAFATPADFSAQVNLTEAKNQEIKAGAEARVQLYKPMAKQKTKLAFLYIHGFSASPVESRPLTEDLAEKWHAHAYLPRLDGHGIMHALEGVSLEKWETEIDRFFHEAEDLGEKVVVIAMSNGAALVTPWIFAHQEKIAAVIFLSPHFKSGRWDSELLRIPVIGKWVVQLVMGKIRIWTPRNQEQKYFWTTAYPSVALIEVIKAAAKARAVDFSQWRVPTLMAYNPVDILINKEVAIDLINKIPAKKIILPVPEAEDDHVIAGNILSPKGNTIIFQAVDEFLQSLEKDGVKK